jgi:hypothetical protein
MFIILVKVSKILKLSLIVRRRRFQGILLYNTTRLTNCYRTFNYILNALVLLYSEIIKQPKAELLIPREIIDNLKLWPYFKDCVGAIDGTYIHAYISAGEQTAWCNCKGYYSQKVFAAYLFNL